MIVALLYLAGVYEAYVDDGRPETSHSAGKQTVTRTNNPCPIPYGNRSALLCTTYVITHRFHEIRGLRPPSCLSPTVLYHYASATSSCGSDVVRAVRGSPAPRPSHSIASCNKLHHQLST